MFENIVHITLLSLSLFGKIEMHTFEIPNSREFYHGYDNLTLAESNMLVCDGWYHANVMPSIKENPKYVPFKKQRAYTLGKYKDIKNIIGYVCGGHEPK